MVQQINENMIREAAYFLWEKAGRPDGSAEFFWMKACEQFFKPSKVAIKKPAKKAAPKKTTTKPVAKKTVAVKSAPVKAVVSKTAAPKAKTKPAVKQEKKTVAPVFYGTRK